MERDLGADQALMAVSAKLRKEGTREGTHHPLVHHLPDITAGADDPWEYVLTEPAGERIAQNLELAADEAPCQAMV